MTGHQDRKTCTGRDDNSAKYIRDHWSYDAHKVQLAT